MNRSTLTVLSLAAHGVALVVLGRIHVLESSRASTAIEVVEVPEKKPPAPDPPPAPPKAAPPAKPKAVRAAAAPPPQALTDASSGLEAGADFGFASTGLAVAAPAAIEAPAPPPAPVVPRVVKRPSAPVKVATCAEPPAKPTLLSLPTPAFPERARASGAQGKVRVALTVDEAGSVVEVRLLAGLGYGFDEAALSAAKAARFTPARRCGKAARSTFTIAMRFSAS